jgi:hypothetical protein
MGARRYRAWPALAIILNESVGTHGEKPRTHINRRAIAKRAGLAGFTTLRHTRASYGPAQGLENCWGKSRRISRQRLEEGLAKERAARCVVLAGLDQSEGASLIQRRRRGMLPRLTSPIRASHRRVSRNGASKPPSLLLQQGGIALTSERAKEVSTFRGGWIAKCAGGSDRLRVSDRHA